MIYVKIKLISACMLILLVSCQCNHNSPASDTTHGDRLVPAKPSVYPDLHKLTIKNVTVYVDIAKTDSARMFGLMKRKSMPEDVGMLFVYREPDFRSFWMKDTLIPLSLAYIDENGRIFQILDMEPLDESSHPSTDKALYVLEVNQGWFEKHAIDVGDEIANLPSPEGAEE